MWAVPALTSVYGPVWLAAWPLAFQPQQATLLSALTPQKLYAPPLICVNGPAWSVPPCEVRPQQSALPSGRRPHVAESLAAMAV